MRWPSELKSHVPDKETEVREARRLSEVLERVMSEVQIGDLGPLI